jgi:hypothetical protein
MCGGCGCGLRFSGDDGCWQGSGSGEKSKGGVVLQSVAVSNQVSCTAAGA